MLARLEDNPSAAGEEGEGAGQPGKPLNRRELEYISPVDFPFLVERIRRLLNQLEMRVSRRQRETRRSRQIDLKRSVRRSLRYGGEIFSLGFTSPRLRRPRIVILCDVSASMVRHVRFTLPLLFGMSRLAKTTRAFVCAGGLEEVTELFRNERDFQKAADWMMRQTNQVGRGTNLGQAFHILRTEFSGALNASTCLLVVSDAETIDPELVVRELRQLSGQVKKTVWLNTQPHMQWRQNKVVPLLRRFAKMEECTTLAKTVKILQSL